jgi:hypothetical protein
VARPGAASPGDHTEAGDVGAPPDAPSGSIIDRYPSAPPVTITHEPVIVGEVAELLWEVYQANFEPLSRVAVTSQSSTYDEMIEFFANPRIHKIVVVDRSGPAAAARSLHSDPEQQQADPQQGVGEDRQEFVCWPGEDIDLPPDEGGERSERPDRSDHRGAEERAGHDGAGVAAHTRVARRHHLGEGDGCRAETEHERAARRPRQLVPHAGDVGDVAAQPRPRSERRAAEHGEPGEGDEAHSRAAEPR